VEGALVPDHPGGVVRARWARTRRSTQVMYVDVLNIMNLRCFEEAEISFIHPEASAHDRVRLKNVNLLLGDNGAGKTTVLRAVALAVLGEVLRYSGFVANRLIRRTKDAPMPMASVVAWLNAEGLNDIADSRATVILERRAKTEILFKAEAPAGMSEVLFDETSPAFFLVGYGATRRVELSDRFDLGAQEKARLLRYRRVATLFEEHVGLVPMSHWMPTLQNEDLERFDEVAAILNALLEGQARFLGEREDSDYLFEVDGNPAPFPALSDGFRAYIGWVADLLYHMVRCVPPGKPLRSLDGIVMVDEIDLHLHPDWQRTVVPALSAALPRMQFILTTHSPLVAGTLEAGNIWQIGARAGQASEARRLQERVHGLSSEQILLGSYFNLESTRAPDMVDELEVLAKRARSGEEDAALAVVQLLARGLPEAEPVEPPRSATVKKRAKRTAAKRVAKPATARRGKRR
jgi:hypothetical protein